MTTEAEKNDAIRARCAAAMAELQGISDLIADPPPEGVTWDRTGVANNPTFSNGDKTVEATGTHILRATMPLLPDTYGEIVIDEVGGSGYLGVGVIAATQSIAVPPYNLVTVPPGARLWRDDGYWATNYTYGSGLPTFGDAANIGLLRNVHGEVFGRINGIWIGDPETRIGPIFTGVSGDDFALCVAFFGANSAPKVTLPSAPVYAVPDGAEWYQVESL